MCCRTRLVSSALVLMLIPAAGRVTAQVAGCGEWEVLPSPNPPGSDYSVLKGVAVVAPDDVWAVGAYTAYYQGSLRNYTLAMHFDGQEWSIVPTPNPSPTPDLTYCGLEAVAALGPNDVWAAGYKNDVGHGGVYVGTHMLVLHWDGASWEVVDTPLPPYYQSIWQQVSGDNIRNIVASAPDDLWFFGDWVEILDPGLSYYRGLALHWDGSSMTITDTPQISGTPGTGLEAGSALAADDIWAVGGGSDGDDADLSMILHWDGSSWTQVPGPTPGYFSRLYDVVALGPNDVWASGDYFDGAYHPLFLHWDGSSWTQHASAFGSRAFAPLAPDRLLSLAGGSVGLWDGSEWTATEPLPETYISIADADVFGECALWTVGRTFVGSTQLTFTARLNSIAPPVVPGDLDCNGTIGFGDINPFVLCLSNPAAWESAYPGCPAANGDLNADGTVDFEDINPFVSLLTR
jgi:hypothetical protein